MGTYCISYYVVPSLIIEKVNSDIAKFYYYYFCLINIFIIL